MDGIRATPSTFVQVGNAEWSLRGVSLHDHALDPRTAAVLAAVLLAAAEQVSAAKLAAFGQSRAIDLSMLGLAMAFRGDDTGLVGDVFEWSVLLAANGADGQIIEMLADALQRLGERFDRPEAVLVAAEPGRLVQYSPGLPSGAALATGRRGRPPHVANILASVDTTTWKADLLIRAHDRWVAASLKSNPRDLAWSLREAAATPYPPRLGVTATDSRRAGVVQDPGSGAVVVNVPADGRYLALSKAVLSDVRDAFERHLAVPGAPLRQDVSGIGRQLHRWQERTVGEVVDMLLDVAGDAALEVGGVHGTGANVSDAHGALVALNPLGEARLISYPPTGWHGARWMVDFDPID